MKTIYLRINHAGYCQPHQYATGAHYAITDCADDASPSAVAQLANLTVIAAPYRDKATPIQYQELGRNKLINRYKTSAIHA